jgi:hypothetical protein
MESRFFRQNRPLQSRLYTFSDPVGSLGRYFLISENSNASDDGGPGAGISVSIAVDLDHKKLKKNSIIMHTSKTLIAGAVT